MAYFGNFRDLVRGLLPPFLSERPGKTVAYRYVYSLMLMYDVLTEGAQQGQQARFPGIGTATALSKIGRDRKMIRGPRETNEGYAARLVRWLDEWELAGTAYGVARQIQAYWAPGVPRVRIVYRKGTWLTLEPDGTFERVDNSPSNWDWDSVTHPSRATNTTDFWIVIYPPHADTDGDWGDPGTWGDPGSFGLDLDPADGAAIQEILQDWKGTAFCRTVIFSYDETQFDPHAPPGDPGLPDGQWGHWGKNVGGVYVPSRFTDCRYLELSPT